MQPDPARDYERSVVERECMLTGLEERLTRIAAQLGDDEVLRLVRAMLDARPNAGRRSGAIEQSGTRVR